MKRIEIEIAGRFCRARRGVDDGVEDLLFRAFVDVREPHAPRERARVHPALDAGQPALLRRARARLKLGVQRHWRKRADGLVQPLEQPAHVIGPGDARGVVREGLERHGRGGGTSIRGLVRALVVTLGDGIAWGLGPPRVRGRRAEGLGRAFRDATARRRARFGFRDEGSRGQPARPRGRRGEASPARREWHQARGHGNLGRSLEGGSTRRAEENGPRDAKPVEIGSHSTSSLNPEKTNIATWRRDRGALLTAQTMETKTCARCKETLPKNQENFPHGSSWCTKCCPVSDSDSDQRGLRA